MNLSVAMATYNGEKYIKKQIDSILIQLGVDDEIVIYDDGSTDYTIDILKEYEKKYKNIRIYKGENIGFVKNFERAIMECNKELIALCDQDDVWKSDKVYNIKRVFNKHNKKLVLHNAGIIDSNSNLIEDKILIDNMKHGFIRNIMKSSYWGCCMVFRHEFKNSILPFPSNLVSHDQWIGMIGEKEKQSYYYDKCLINHRYHNNNVTSKKNIIKRLYFRFNLLSSYIKFKYLGGNL